FALLAHGQSYVAGSVGIQILAQLKIHFLWMMELSLHIFFLFSMNLFCHSKQNRTFTKKESLCFATLKFSRQIEINIVLASSIFSTLIHHHITAPHASDNMNGILFIVQACVVWLWDMFSVRDMYRHGMMIIAWTYPIDDILVH
ncbi:hypothetical protein ACJX0J_033523, partial [Zea mays]